VLGERSILEGGRRTATLRAASRVRVAAVPVDRIDPARLAELRESHRREEPPPEEG
jgi:CRP-like cAMP-binding protein